MLSTKEQLKIDITAKAAANLIPKKLAAKILNISMATIFRYCQEYREKGPLFIIHGNKGKPSPASTDPIIKKKILDVISEKYYDFTVRHAWEKLAVENLQVITYKTLLKWCRDKKFVKRIRRKKRKGHRARPRMPQRGIMLQMDGSYHNWFGNEKSCLIAAIDDADNDIPYAEFCDWETTLSCMKVLKNIIRIKGIFKVLYVDKAGVFGGTKRINFSQLEDACNQLGIQLIYANSAEAKGRIERCWGTLQGRLIPEFRLNGITTRDNANQFLMNEYLPNHYRKSFTVPVINPISEYTSIDPQILDEIFCVKETRKIKNDQTFSFEAIKYIVTDNGHYTNGIIEIRKYPENEQIKCFFRGNEVSFQVLDEYLKEVA
jgi:transposase